MSETKKDTGESGQYVIIIGAMKSGTTFLYEHLCDHPNISRCRVKEPNFFLKGKYREQGKQYEHLWNFNNNIHTYRLEASTGYTKYPLEEGVPGRIKEYGISPKFIYVVRNPVERIESQYNFMRISKSKNIFEFTDDRLIEPSKYFKQLSRFLDVFPNKNKYKILSFKDLIENTSCTLNECYSFLNLDRSYEYKKKGVQNRTPRHRTDEWIDKLGEAKNKIGRLMTKSQRKTIKRCLRILSPRTEHKGMDRSDRKAVQEILEEDMERFKKEFGFNTEDWGF